MSSSATVLQSDECKIQRAPIQWPDGRWGLPCLPAALPTQFETAGRLELAQSENKI